MTLVSKFIRQIESRWQRNARKFCKDGRGDHHTSTKHLNEDFIKLLKKMNIAAGQSEGLTVHSLRRSFKSICINALIPREVVDIWQDHAHVRTAGDLYYTLPDNEIQKLHEVVAIL